jgi:hypothetical protein
MVTQLLEAIPVVGPVLAFPVKALGWGMCWLLTQPPETSKGLLDTVLGVSCAASGGSPAPTP